MLNMLNMLNNRLLDMLNNRLMMDLLHDLAGHLMGHHLGRSLRNHHSSFLWDHSGNLDVGCLGNHPLHLVLYHFHHCLGNHCGDFFVHGIVYSPCNLPLNDVGLRSHLSARHLVLNSLIGCPHDSLLLSCHDNARLGHRLCLHNLVHCLLRLQNHDRLLLRHMLSLHDSVCHMLHNWLLHMLHMLHMLHSRCS